MAPSEPFAASIERPPESIRAADVATPPARSQPLTRPSAGHPNTSMSGSRLSPSKDQTIPSQKYEASEGMTPPSASNGIPISQMTAARTVHPAVSLERIID